MGANFLNYRAHELYTINGNKIDETFVKWDQEKGKCFAGFASVKFGDQLNIRIPFPFFFAS